jgi:hypothetical protein
MLHREPVIELIGVDPYKFVELRSLGLLNEQIDWKQRFFVPTDEETGIAVLHNLFARYPIIPSEAFDKPQATYIEPRGLSRPKVVNLYEWFVPVVDVALVPSGLLDEIDDAEPTTGIATFYVVQATASTQHSTESQLALDFG